MDEEGNYKKTETFLHKGGVQEFVELMCKEKQHLHPEVKVKQTRAAYAVSRGCFSPQCPQAWVYPFALCVSPIDLRFFKCVQSLCFLPGFSRASHGPTRSRAKDGRGGCG